MQAVPRPLAAKTPSLQLLLLHTVSSQVPQQPFAMVVVKNPSENRLAMAKPPPKKLEPQVADKINAERKEGWNSECSSRRILSDLATYSSDAQQIFSLN
jgi:hypothetical protein